MKIHARENQSDLTVADENLLTGVLDFSRKMVTHIMTPKEKLFTIPVS